jgi:integrase
MSEKPPQVRGIIEESAIIAPPVPANDLATPSPDLSADAARAVAYAQEARADATKRAYAADWRGFEQWCGQRGVHPHDAKPAAVAAYLADMADRGYQATTIERAATGIAWHMRAIDPPSWPRGTQPDAVMLTIAGIRRTLGVARRYRKASATIDMVRDMLPHLGGGLEGLRNRAIVLTGFWCAIRRSEVAGLDVTDVAIDQSGMRVVVRRSKTDQEGAGFERGIRHTSSSNAPLCAPCTVARWLQLAPAASGPLFRVCHGELVQPQRIKPELVAELVQRGAAGLGMRPSRFGAHSLRAGFVTTAAKKGKSLDAIMRQTGHKTVEQVREYIRHATIFDDNATEDLE